MEENKRKQYAHLYEHHEVEDPQPREEKEKPIGPSGFIVGVAVSFGVGVAVDGVTKSGNAVGIAVGVAVLLQKQTHRLFFPGHGGCSVTCIELFSDQRGKKGSGFGIYPQRKAANEKS